MEFSGNQHFVQRCPFCSAEYDLDDAKVIAEQDESTMVYVSCADCESSIIALVAMSAMGVVSLGLVTDMTEADTKQFMDQKDISSDELLSMYELLEKNTLQAFKKLTGTVK
ncbi:hypothetical protein IH781_00535 [Patescibacteria group bacterium]|nr:hypothetical protein [Patescibacteria group bacterium]